MKKFVSFGEVLMRLSVRSEEKFATTRSFDVWYGGSESNIASALANWGMNTMHVSALPDGQLGQAAVRSLMSFGTHTDAIIRKEGRLGLYFLEPGADLRSPSVIYDRSDSVFAKTDFSTLDWHHILSGADWFHWSGITPAISLSAAMACKTAIEVANKLGVFVSADINYRRNLWGYGKKPSDIMPDLIAGSDLVVGSTEDIENTTGWRKIEKEVDFETSAKSLITNFQKVKYVACTTREVINTDKQELGAHLVHEGAYYKSAPYMLTAIVDRIGSGDAFMAGLVYGKSTNMNTQQMLDFALAAAAYKHTIQGDVLLASITEIDQLINGTNIGKLLR